MKASAFACLLPVAAGHGSMVWPMPRSNKGCQKTMHSGDMGYGDSIEWYNHWCVIDEPECDPSKGNGQNDGQQSRHPGNDPGVSPTIDHHPCAGRYLDEQHFHPFGDFSFDCGSTVWKANETVDVRQWINNNHGGYYQYRLCPLVNKDYKNMKQADCHAVMEFVSDQIGELPRFKGILPGGAPSTYSTAVDRVGRKDGTIWRKLDFMRTDGSVYVDQVRVPNLPDGAYVLQWRWDCIGTAQVWSSCADITLWGNSPSPTPAPKPRPPGRCHSLSASITDDWCKTNCWMVPPNCPPALCTCEGNPSTIV